MLKPLLSLFLLMLIIGCSSQLNYKPEKIASKYEARQVLERVLAEQPGNFAPQSVEVTDNYFKVVMLKNSVNKGALAFGFYAQTTYDKATTIYFESIGSIELYNKRNWFAVIIKDKAGVERYRVVTYIEDDAKSCVNALSSLIPRSIPGPN